jgi:hypothetical protein
MRPTFGPALTVRGNVRKNSCPLNYLRRGSGPQCFDCGRAVVGVSAKATTLQPGICGRCGPLTYPS